MSCHTWAYCKISLDEEREIRKDLFNYLKKSWKIVPDNMSEKDYVDLKFTEVGIIYPNLTYGDILQIIHDGNIKFRHYLSIIETCDLKQLCKIVDDVGGTSYRIHNSYIYKMCGFDEPIRIYGYPEEVFIDVDKFIEWIKKTEEKEGRPISSYYNPFLDKFVSGFDDFAEKLVRGFWYEHNDEVYLEFG
jgi:hypothetical protein